MARMRNCFVRGNDNQLFPLRRLPDVPLDGPANADIALDPAPPTLPQTVGDAKDLKRMYCNSLSVSDFSG